MRSRVRDFRDGTISAIADAVGSLGHMHPRRLVIQVAKGKHSLAIAHQCAGHTVSSRETRAGRVCSHSSPQGEQRNGDGSLHLEQVFFRRGWEKKVLGIVLYKTGKEGREIDVPKRSSIYP